jgi:hypothetical protein
MNAADTTGTGCVNNGGAFGTGDTVDLTGLSGTITLAGASEIEINLSLAIQGPGSTVLAVSGANASRVFNSTASLPAILRISDLTIANGRAEGPGGCVLVENELRLTNAVVTGCTAVHDPVEYPSYLSGIGGGIAASVLLTQSSTISGNTAENAGGGVFAKYSRHYASSMSGNTVTGRACDTTSNTKYCLPTILGGGGILGGSVQLYGSTVSGNTVNASAITSTSGDGTQTPRRHRRRHLAVERTARKCSRRRAPGPRARSPAGSIRPHGLPPGRRSARRRVISLRGRPVRARKPARGPRATALPTMRSAWSIRR